METQKNDGDDEDNDTGGVEDPLQDEPTVIEKELNTEDDVLMECEAACRKRNKEEKTWIKHCEGTLRLYRNKIDPQNQKMVIRDNCGHVRFNVAVKKNMSFTKESTAKKGSINFMACEYASKGLESFKITVRLPHHERLFTTLKSMAA